MLFRLLWMLNLSTKVQKRPMTDRATEGQDQVRSTAYGTEDLHMAQARPSIAVTREHCET